MYSISINSLALNLFPVRDLRDAIDCCSTLFMRFMLIYVHIFMGVTLLLILLIILFVLSQKRSTNISDAASSCFILMLCYCSPFSQLFVYIFQVLDLLFHLLVWTTQNPFTFLGRCTTSCVLFITHLNIIMS